MILAKEFLAILALFVVLLLAALVALGQQSPLSSNTLRTYGFKAADDPVDVDAPSSQCWIRSRKSLARGFSKFSLKILTLP